LAGLKHRRRREASLISQNHFAKLQTAVRDSRLIRYFIHSIAQTIAALLVTMKISGSSSARTL
jgi:hypothetical protein